MADITTGRTDFTIELYVCDILEFSQVISQTFLNLKDAQL